MIPDDEVMRVLERADPARVDEEITPLDSADYLDVLRTSTLTLIGEPRPPRRLRRRLIVAGAAAAAVVIVAAGLVSAVSRDDIVRVRPVIPPTVIPSTTAAASSTTARVSTVPAPSTTAAPLIVPTFDAEGIAKALTPTAPVAAAPSASTVPPPSPTTPPAPPTADAASAARVGLMGLPPEGAPPSARGQLVDSYFIVVGGYQYAGVARVYADGRLIWRLAFPDGVWTLSTGWVEQRLTPLGVELVRTGHGNPLLLLESLPASAWEDRQFRTYIPVGYAACMGLRDPSKFGEAQTTSVSLPPLERLLAALPAPAADLLRSRPTVPAFALHPQYDCLVLTTDDARRLDRALSDAGLEADGIPMVGYLLEYLGQDGIPLEMGIRLEPVFPDGTISCSACG